MERWNPGWTLGRIEAGSRAGAEDPRGPRSVRRRLISKERLRPYGSGTLHAPTTFPGTRWFTDHTRHSASRARTSSPPVPVRARRDPRGLFASYSHSRTFDIGDCSVHRVPRQVLRAVACRYSRHGVFVRAPLASPSPTAHAAAQRRQGTTTAGHASKRQTRFTGASPSLRPLVAA